jgi:hypothetical protein
MFKSHLSKGYSNYINNNDSSNNKGVNSLHAKKIPTSHLNLITKALVKMVCFHLFWYLFIYMILVNLCILEQH